MMSLRPLIQFIVVLVFSTLNTIYACDTKDLTSIHEEAGLTYFKVSGYAPDTLPLSFFEELAKNGKVTREITPEKKITYAVEDQSLMQAMIPYNLMVSDKFMGHRESLEIKLLTARPEPINNDLSKLALKYAYQGRWGSGQQIFTFYAHLNESEDEESEAEQYFKEWTNTLNILQNFTIHHQEKEENTFIATLSLGEDEEKVDSFSLLKQVTTAAQFVAPYVLNDVAQSLAPKLVPAEALVALNAFSAKCGYDTPLHALLSQGNAQEDESDPLDQKRKEITKTSEAIGSALAFIPGATKVRTAINLACQYGGYGSLTHLIKGVPSKQKGSTVEEDSYQKKIELAKGTARLAIVLFVPGGKFVVIGSQIYQFVVGKSITQTVVEKVTNSHADRT